MRASTYPAIRDKRTKLGASIRLFYLNIGLCFLFVSIFRSFYPLALNLILHLIFVWLESKGDLFEIYLKYMWQGDFYRPWVSRFGWQRNRRPEGFGRP